MSELLLLLHQPGRVVQWPAHEVAMLREEWDGRLEATHAHGEVAHRPGPLTPVPPLHEVSHGTLVNPVYARHEDGQLLLPGGWTLPAAPLPEPSDPPSEDPDRELAVARRGKHFFWLTPSGKRPCALSWDEVLERHSDFVRFGRHLVHPAAVRSLQRYRTSHAHLTLAGGHLLKASWKAADNVVLALGLPWPDLLADLPAGHRVPYERGLRDWPGELRFADPDQLHERYSEDPLLMIDHALWQVYRLRQQGLADDYGTTPRGLHYVPMMTLAVRAGVVFPGASLVATEPLGPHLSPALRSLWDASLPEKPALLALASAWASNRLWFTLLDRLDRMVGEWRLVTYRGLGMRDQGGPHRLVGEQRPHHVLLVEKSSLEVDARLVASMFGTSMLVLGGTPTWIATEFFVDHLQPTRPVHIISLCDFDPYGWHFPEVFSTMLERYGATTAGLVRLVKPDRFSAQELERLAIPLSRAGNKKKIVDRFVRESGGVGGRPLGLYADYLRPVERLVEAFQEETGLEPVMTLAEASKA